jgi:hypothetical protein
MLIPLLEDSGPLEAPIRLEIADSLMSEDKVKEAVGILAEIDPANEGLVERLEMIVAEKTPDPDALLVLSRAMRVRNSEESFRRYAGMLLDVSSEDAEEIASLSAALGEELGSAGTLIFAADVVDRFGLPSSSEELLMKAIGFDSSIADQLAARKDASLPFQALCFLASTNGSKFAEVMRRRSGLEIPLDEGTLERARSSWNPGRDDQALWFLAELAGRSGFEAERIEILSGLAKEGIGGWGPDSSRELMLSAASSPDARVAFWTSVSSREVLEEALGSIAGAGVEGAGGTESSDELKAIGDAVNRVGLSPAQTAAVARMLIDSGDTELSPVTRELGRRCYDDWVKNPEAIPASDIIGLLLDSGLPSEASEVALSVGSNTALLNLRKGLSRIRKQDDPTMDRLSRALMKLDVGDYEACLSLLGEMEGKPNAQRSDLAARALWGLGRREAAIHTWLSCYRTSGEPVFLQRVHWACGKAGHLSEQAGVGRAIASGHPEATSGLDRLESVVRKLRTIE